MPIAGDKYYVQGFCLDTTKTTITFVQSLSTNSISYGSKVVITFKPGSKSSDFSNMLPDGVTIFSNRSLSQMRITKLTPNIININSHSFECYDMENRVVNYLVVWDRESTTIEEEHHTAFIINKDDVGDQVKLTQLLDGSKYIKFRTYPIGEFYSYRLINTHSSDALLSSDPTGNGNPRVNNGLKFNEISIKSYVNTPIYLSKYTPYRLEYSKVLLRFYEELELQLPGFTIYSDSNKIGLGDSMESDRITISLEGLGDISRRSYMNDLDIIDSMAILTIKINTSDHLKYMHIKNSFQNLTLLSNLARFNTKDTYNLDWLSHVEWDPYKDNVRMKEVRDEGGRFSYSMDLRCSLYYYIVKDKLYPLIKWIDTKYVHLENGKGMNLKII